MSEFSSTFLGNIVALVKEPNLKFSFILDPKYEFNLASNVSIEVVILSFSFVESTKSEAQSLK